MLFHRFALGIPIKCMYLPFIVIKKTNSVMSNVSIAQQQFDKARPPKIDKLGKWYQEEQQQQQRRAKSCIRALWWLLRMYRCWRTSYYYVRAGLYSRGRMVKSRGFQKWLRWLWSRRVKVVRRQQERRYVHLFAELLISNLLSLKFTHANNHTRVPYTHTTRTKDYSYKNACRHNACDLMESIYLSLWSAAQHCFGNT